MSNETLKELDRFIKQFWEEERKRNEETKK